MSWIKAISFFIIAFLLFFLVGCGGFDSGKKTFSFNINIIGEGEVEVIDVVEPKTEEYKKDSVIFLRAEPSEGWEFISWSGDGDGTSPAISVTLDRDKEIIAEFDFDRDGEFAGGNGSGNEPFLVGNEEQLNNVRNNLSANFKQIAHIDLTAFSGGLGWKPIGDGDNPFSGTYDGNGFTITNLKIERTVHTTPDNSNIGLFGYSGEDSKLIGIVLEGVNIKGHSCVGAIAGRGNGTIENCLVSGMVVADGYWAGGIIGLNEGIIKLCRADVESKSNYYFAGGLAGENQGEIKLSYAIGTVEVAVNNAGGLVSRNYGEIENSYSRGSVLGKNFLGGLVGYNLGTIKNSFSTGTVKLISGDGPHLGGLVGSNSVEAEIISSYWDKLASEMENSDGGEGRTTPQLQKGTPGAYITPEGLADTGEDSNNLMYMDWDITIWDFGGDQDYPSLHGPES